MLLREQCGRGQHGHLPVVLHNDERGPHGDLGLAKPGVAAHQPIHGPRPTKVPEHGLDRVLLAGRLFKRKILREGPICGLVKLEGAALARGAAGLQFQQFGRDIRGPPGRLLFGLLPLPAAEFVQRRMLGIHAGIARDQAERRDRHIEPVALGIFKLDKLGRDAAGVEGGEAQIAAHAVFLMHHGRAGV